MKRQRRIIAIDPGEQTGYAIGSIGPEGFRVTGYGYDDWRTFVLNYDHVMQGGDPFGIVVYESWRLRAPNAKQMVGSDFPSSQCIGCVKLGAWRNKATLVTVEPSYKPVIDAQMGGIDYLPMRDSVEHYRDACRHLCWYAVNKAGFKPESIRDACHI